MNFLDVTGASGTTYRFREARLDRLPASAGNLLAVTGAPPRLTYVVCAAARSLAAAAAPVREAIGGARDVRAYVRLNVSRATREAEHADIVAAHPPDHDLPDLG
jgi:hypothetical protein